MSTNECITVVVRCRPMNRKENEENRKSIIQIDSESRQVAIINPEAPNEPPKSFTYDASYDENTQQRIFYEESCFNVIESTLEGFNSTIFAYGQTGCGKSFTMQGPSTTDENLRGVIPNSFLHIFQFVKSTKDIEFLIRCSYLELYNEEIRDLLGNPKSNTKCELKEDPNKGIYVKNLTDVVVETPEDLYKMLDKGLTNRTVASTLMNSESSRSHSIFTIVIEMNTKDPTTGKDMLRVGKLNLVDLAGSERAKKTGAKDQTLKEGIKINLSLSVLGNVISALSEGAKHIPYRDSKLTRLLQDSLGGNTKTMMVAAISPADYNYDETLSTLRYANRAKNIKNKPKINEDPKDTMIREFKAEIERLKKMLMEQASASQILAQLGIAPQDAAMAMNTNTNSAAVSHTASMASIPHQGSTSIAASSLEESTSMSMVMATQAGGVQDGYSSQHQQAVGSIAQQVQQAQPYQQQFLDEDRRQLELQHQQHLQQRQQELDQQQELLYQQHQHPHAHHPGSIEDSSYSSEIRGAAGSDFEIEGSPMHLQPRPSPHHSQTHSQTQSSHHSSSSPQRQSTAEEDEYADAGFESAEHTGEFSKMRLSTPPQNSAASAEMMLNNNPELEEQLRSELANRLNQLQHMLVTAHTEAHPTASSSKLSPIKEVLGATNNSIAEEYSPIKATNTKTQEEIDEEEAEAARIYRERKMKAKKKREEKAAKEAEMQRILDEKRMMEEELEELRASAASNPLPSGVNTSRDGLGSAGGNGIGSGGESGNSDTAKKLSKLKKKYEKKVQNMQEEMNEMRDEFEYQRKQLLDNIVEQEKDLKLYELICKALISEKDFKKIIEKCRYDEDNDEWIIPYIKKKQSIDIYEANNGSSSGYSNNNNNNVSGSNTNRGGYSSGSSMLPDINQKGSSNVKESEQFDQTMKFSAAMTFNLGSNGGNSSSSNNNNNGTKKDKSHKLRSDGSTGKIPVVPLLTLPGQLISASSLLDSQSDRVDSSHSNNGHGNGYGHNSHSNNSYAHHGHSHGPDRSSARSDYDFPAVSSSMTSGRNNLDHNSNPSHSAAVVSNSLPGIGFEKKKLPPGNGNGTGASSSSSTGNTLAAVKAPNKIPKAPPSGTSGNKMPSIGGNHSYQDYGFDHGGHSNQGGDDYDNDGGGDDNYGAAPTSARIKKKKHRDRESRGSRDVAPEPTSARGNGGGGGGGSSLPPIGMKHATPRLGGGGGGSLPPI